MKNSSALSELKKGMELPRVSAVIDRESISLYAKASRDFNPVHIDPSFAAKAHFGGVIAHGMLLLSYVSRMLTAAFGQKWFDNCRLDVRFKAPARPGDEITVSGIIRDVESSQKETLVFCDISCRNQGGEAVILGEARVRL
jgi:3-hydroxybutyryl-CoA dehydratase